MWFESDIKALLDAIAQHLTERKDSDGIRTFATYLPEVMTIFGRNWAVIEGLHALNTILPHFRKQCDLIGTGSTDGDRSKEYECLDVIEAYSCSFISLVLGISARLETFTTEQFKKHIAQQNWSKRESIYTRNPLPRTVTQELEQVQECLDFEIRVEKKVVSPEWVVLEKPARELLRYLADTSTALVTGYESVFGTEIERLSQAGKHLYVAQLAQRGLEAYDKVSRKLAIFQSYSDQLAEMNRSKEWEWPKPNWEALQNRVDEVKRTLVITLAKSIHSLAALPESEKRPDYFGQAYSVLADECFDAMRHGDDEMFRKIFPAFFGAALLAFDKLRQNITSANTNEIRLSAEPIVDLMALSGYAAVIADLDAKQFWVLVKRSWDLYFTSIADPPRIKSMATMLCMLLEPTLFIAPRDLLRMRWKRSLEALLRERNILPGRARYDAYVDARRNPVQHSSPLVRTFAQLEFFADAEDVFVALYVLKRPEALGVRQPHKAEHFNQMLNREVKKNEA